MHIAVRVILALLYLFSGLGLFLGRKKLLGSGKPPNLVIPAILLLVAAATTLFLR